MDSAAHGYHEPPEPVAPPTQPPPKPDDALRSVLAAADRPAASGHRFMRTIFAFEGPMMSLLAAGEGWLIESGRHALLAGFFALPALVMLGVGWAMTWQAFTGDWTWGDA